MTRYRFRDLLSGINLTKWIDADPRLRDFRARIAKRIQHPDPQVRARKAQLLTERVLVAANDSFALHYLDQMTPHIERIVELREEVTKLYKSLQGLTGGKKLPADVTPDKLMRLFRELEEHMDALEGNTPTKHFKENVHEIPMDDVGKLIEEGQIAEAPTRKTPEDESVSPEREPTLDLDDPTKVRPDAHLVDVSQDFKFKEETLADGTEVKEASGWLGEPGEVQTHRNELAQTHVSGETGDVAGHLLGNQFGTPGDERNLVRMHEIQNLSTYKKMENSWARLLKDGYDVHATAKAFIKPGADRPFMVSVTWTEKSPSGTTRTKELTFFNPESPEVRAKAGQKPVIQDGDVIDMKEARKRLRGGDR